MIKVKVRREKRFPVLQKVISVFTPEQVEKIAIATRRKMKRDATFFTGKEEHGKLKGWKAGERGQLKGSINLIFFPGKKKARISTADPGSLMVEFKYKPFFRPGVKFGNKKFKRMSKALIKLYRNGQLRVVK
jgi:hypothetical protein